MYMDLLLHAHYLFDSYAALRETVASNAVAVAEQLELSKKDNARKSTETAMQVGSSFFIPFFLSHSISH